MLSKKIENLTKVNFRQLELLLRIAVFLTFLGHGIFAIKGTESWLFYLDYVGFSSDTSKELIFFIGIQDVLVSLIVLFKPNKYVVLWAVIWTFLTALIRPISGESIWAFVERGANWITPLVLYLLIKNK